MSNSADEHRALIERFQQQSVRLERDMIILDLKVFAMNAGCRIHRTVYEDIISWLQSGQTPEEYLANKKDKTKEMNAALDVLYPII